MCGIFGFVLKEPVSLSRVFEVLKRLESSRYPDEATPVGGFGAGLAVMLRDGDVISEKVGKTGEGSPVTDLEQVMKSKVIMNTKVTNASVLVAHVRYPSPENMGTAKYREAAQPYVGHFEREHTIVSVHNGKVVNFMELKAQLSKHVFESEKIGFIDSEIIPHYFDELLNELENSDAAVYELFDALKGSNVVALLQIDEENAFLHLLYRGKARGLTVWANDKGEMIFCTRPEPVESEFKSILAIGKFSQKASINHRENAGLKLSFPAIFQ
jgi:glucosamine 6-phosphate synthetase-like amidotransferase/phosphosugar isomerase protein